MRSGGFERRSAFSPPPHIRLTARQVTRVKLLKSTQNLEKLCKRSRSTSESVHGLWAHYCPAPKDPDEGAETACWVSAKSLKSGQTEAGMRSVRSATLHAMLDGFATPISTEAPLR